MKRIVVFFLMTVLCLCASGCVVNNKEIEYRVENGFPNAKLVSTDVIKENGWTETRYNFTNGDFEFYFSDASKDAEHFADKLYVDEDDSDTGMTYLASLLQYKKTEIEKLFSKHNILVVDDSLKIWDEQLQYDDAWLLMEENNANVVCSTEVYSFDGNEIEFTFYVRNVEDADVVCLFLNEFKELMEDYLLTDMSFYCPDVDVELKLLAGEKRVLASASETFWFTDEDLMFDDLVATFEKRAKENLK